MDGPIKEVTSEMLYPLSLFCDTVNQEALGIQVIEESELEEPDRSLLAHSSDMTTKLETFHHGTIELLVLQCSMEGDSHRREVVLRIKGSDKPVEYGAIDINLAAFNEEVREIIIQGQRPLGGILTDFNIKYKSEPMAFIKVTSNANINKALGLTKSRVLYGRRNVLKGDLGIDIAHIIEILPPSQ